MARRRILLSTTVLAVGLFVAMDEARAQTERTTLGGLRASIDESDEARPRRRSARRRGEGRRPGSPQRQPQYGNPPGSGAGDTGYVSTNPPRTEPTRAGAGAARNAARTTLGNAAARFGDARASTRPARPGSGANTGPSRPGASIDVPPGTATQPIRRKRPPEEDPFEPTGVHAGGFMLRPAIETTGGYDTNPSRSSGGRGSAFITVAPELRARSNWSRHALNADLRGSYTAYAAASDLNRPYFDGRVNGRIDIRRNTRADLEVRGIVSTDNPNSPDLPADLARLPINTTVGGTAGIAHQINRFEVALKGSVDRVVYQDSQLTDGSTISNRDRNYNQYAATLRTSYELTPGMKPFVEGQFDTRDRDLPVDSSGVNRNSDGVTARAGTTFEYSRKLTGEVSIGYLARNYQDPSLQDFRALIVDGSLIWTATALTAVKLTAKTTADESTVPGVSGVLRRDFGVQVDHAFRRWLTGTARFGFGLDDYEGSARKDKRYVASIGVIYKLNREMQLKGEVRQEWLRSTIPGNDYTATIALVGLRLQR